MGIDAGTPSSIPYVEQDFIFSAICEELGVIFGICLIAVFKTWIAANIAESKI